jgi:hypothetical protein
MGVRVLLAALVVAITLPACISCQCSTKSPPLCCPLVPAQISVQTAALRETLLPLLQLSAALASGKPPAAKDAEAAAKTARGGALHTLRRAGRLLWGGLAPGVALDASLRLLEALAGALVADVLAKRVCA